MDVPRQIEYWREGAEEDVEAAEVLLEKGKLRHALFFAHLALEKMLKALVTRATAEIPPKTHSLVRLAELSELTIPEERLDFLRGFNAYQAERRYPWRISRIRLDQKQAVELFSGAKEVLMWLTAQL